MACSTLKNFDSPEVGDIWTEPVTGMEFVWVPGGCFQMGDIFGTGREDERPVHRICLDGFWIGRYEVTRQQWRKVMEQAILKQGSATGVENKEVLRFDPLEPSLAPGEMKPVVRVSWNLVKQFIAKFQNVTGVDVRLPCEAEWEYACRSGGADDLYSGSSDANRTAWYRANSNMEPHDVGTKASNGLSVFDMSGNVWEWCEDVYAPYEAVYDSSCPFQKPEGAPRILRGGSYMTELFGVRSFVRGYSAPAAFSLDIGFRLVRGY